MSSSTSPVEIHAAMKAALFLFRFILISSFRHDIHYSFHSSEGEQDNVTSTFPLFKCWVYFGGSLDVILLWRNSHCCDMYSITYESTHSRKWIWTFSVSYTKRDESTEYHTWGLICFSSTVQIAPYNLFHALDSLNSLKQITFITKALTQAKQGNPASLVLSSGKRIHLSGTNLATLSFRLQLTSCPEVRLFKNKQKQSKSEAYSDILHCAGTFLLLMFPIISWNCDTTRAEPSPSLSVTFMCLGRIRLEGMTTSLPSLRPTVCQSIELETS